MSTDPRAVPAWRQRAAGWERHGGRPRLSVAPMMALTDRHFRRLARLLSREVLLYTEMVTAKAVLHVQRRNLVQRVSRDDDSPQVKQEPPAAE